MIIYFKFLYRFISQSSVSSAPVVPAFNPFKDCKLSLLLIGIGFRVNPLNFDCLNEAFSNSIIPSIPFPSWHPEALSVTGHIPSQDLSFLVSLTRKTIIHVFLVFSTPSVQ